MSESENFSFATEAGEQQTISSKDPIAVLPNKPDDGLATIIYVEHPEGETLPPEARIVHRAKSTSYTTSPPATSDTETHVIVSRASGTCKAEEFNTRHVEAVIKTLFPEGNDNFLRHSTDSESSIRELTSDIFLPTANAGISLRIILLSGDGGIIDIVNGLLAKPGSSDYKAPEVVLLPLGTANALYHSINRGKDNTWGLRSLASSTTKPLPVFTTSFSPGARLLVDEARQEEELPTDAKSGRPILHGTVVCSWGMHASLVADSDTTEYRKFGVERFKMAAKEALYPADGSPPHAYKAQVSVLQQNTWTPLETEEHMYVLATQVSHLEKPFCISPATQPLDGSIHLVHFGPTSGDEAMRIMGLAYQGGKHVDDPAITYKAIDGLRIEFLGKETDARWRRICVDGKIVALEENGWVEMRKNERRVLDVVI